MAQSTSKEQTGRYCMNDLCMCLCPINNTQLLWFHFTWWIVFCCSVRKTTTQTIDRAEPKVSSMYMVLRSFSQAPVIRCVCLQLLIHLDGEREPGIYELTDISSLKSRASLIALLGLTKYTLLQGTHASNTHSIWPLKPGAEASAATPGCLCSSAWICSTLSLIVKPCLHEMILQGIFIVLFSCLRLFLCWPVVSSRGIRVAGYHLFNQFWLVCIQLDVRKLCVMTLCYWLLDSWRSADTEAFVYALWAFNQQRME